MNGNNGACLFLLLLILLLLLSVLRICEWECLIREIYCRSLFSYMVFLAQTMENFFFFFYDISCMMFSQANQLFLCFFFISDKAQCECAVYCCFRVAQEDGEIKTR